MKESYKWMLASLGLILLLGIIFWDSSRQRAKIQKCKQQRIIPLSEEYFSWEGILKLNQEKRYQPNCL